VRGVRKFEEFIKENVVKRQHIDKSRAQFLDEESEKEYQCLLEMIDKLKVNNKNAHLFVKLCYDILLELIRAKMLLDGYSASGRGAHEAEVSYMRNLDFNEKDVQFVDQIRFFRNGMLYYGTRIDQEYAEKVIEFTKTTYTKIKNIVNSKMKSS